MAKRFLALALSMMLVLGMGANVFAGDSENNTDWVKVHIDNFDDDIESVTLVYNLEEIALRHDGGPKWVSDIKYDQDENILLDRVIMDRTVSWIEVNGIRYAAAYHKNGNPNNAGEGTLQYTLGDPLPGTLTITKTVVAPEGDETFEGKTFTFNILNAAEEQVGTITIADGESDSISLAPGTYTVEEVDANVEGYTLEVSELVASYTVDANATTNAYVTNTYTADEPEPTTGQLKITKNVVAPEGFPTGQTFSFSVWQGETQVTEDIDANDIRAIVLANGNSATIRLPAGAYTVTEADAMVEGYTLTVTGLETAFEVSATAPAIADVTNTYTSGNTQPEPKNGTLTINKTVTAPEGFATKVFTFNIFNDDNQPAGTLTITNSGSASIDLAPGTYTVTEADANVEGYTLTVSGLAASYTVVAEATTTVNVTNAYTTSGGGDNTGGDNTGGGNTGGDSNPVPVNNQIETLIAPEEPLEPLEEIVLDDVLTDYQGEDALLPEEIVLEDVLADLPKTGAESLTGYALGAMAAFGGILGLLRGKKKDDQK